MRSLLKTAAIAAVSSMTTALLLGACVVEDPTRGQGAPTAQAPNPAPAPTAQPPEASGSAARGVGVQAPTITTARASTQGQASGQNAAVGVYQRNGASVVNITSLAVVRGMLGQSMQPQGVGSGFIWDADGRIATNNHVVQDADQLTVTFQDRTTVPASLVGRDPDNDLAIIKVDPNGTDEQGRSIRDRIRPVTLGDSDRVTIGEDAIAIGSPLGLQQTVTAGIVSALRNPGEESSNPQGQIDLLGGAIQTDASINPGNSGGPLFNAAGEVIGVNTAILSQSGGNEGIGFAIPVNVMKRVAPELIQNGRYRHPQLGITSIPLSLLGQAAKQRLNIPPNLKGLLVQEVSAGAQQAGIRAGNQTVNLGGEQVRAGGDIVVAVDGRPVATGGDLRGYIENNKHPGDTVTVTVLRGGQRLDVQVTLSERPASQQPRGR